MLICEAAGEGLYAVSLAVLRVLVLPPPSRLVFIFVDFFLSMVSSGNISHRSRSRRHH